MMQIVSFSIAIDATKVPQLLEISTAFKAIMGGTHPHHMISTIDLDSATIKKIRSWWILQSGTQYDTDMLPLWSFRSQPQEHLTLSLYQYQHSHNLTMSALALLYISWMSQIWWPSRFNQPFLLVWPWRQRMTWELYAICSVDVATCSLEQLTTSTTWRMTDTSLSVDPVAHMMESTLLVLTWYNR